MKKLQQLTAEQSIRIRQYVAAAHLLEWSHALTVACVMKLMKGQANPTRIEELMRETDVNWKKKNP